MHMRTRVLFLGIGVVLVLLVSAACARAAPTPTPVPTPTATPRPAATPTPTATPAATPTATPTPRPGETPVVRPTATPTPTPMPPTPTPTPGVTVKRGGALNLGDAEPPHWDAHQSVIQDLLITDNTNNYLVRLDAERMEVAQPDLARSWEMSQDGKKITFRLNSGIKFHDGQPFSCADVQYSYQRIMSPPKGMASPRKGQLEPVASVECADPLTVVFNLKRVWADAMPNIADPYNIIYPKHVAQPNDEAGKFMRNTLIGTGAFKLKRVVSGEVAEVERNPDYWKPGLPYLDTYRMWNAGEMRSRLAGVESGRFDYVRQLDSPPLANEAQSRSRGRFTVKTFPLILFVNFVPDMHPGSVWNDIEVRKAAALAICHDDFIATMSDLAFVRWFSGPLPQSSQFALPEADIRKIAGYGKDCAAELEQAREIFKAKGMLGYKLFIRSRNDISAFKDSTVVVAEMLSKAGVVATTELMEQGPYYELVDNKRIPVGNAVVHSIAIASNTPDAILGQSFHPDGVRNYGAYDDDKLRQMFQQQSAETDVAKRKALLQEYQRYFMSQYYHVILGYRGGGRLIANYVKGPLYDTPPFYIWPSIMEEVWLDK